MLAKKILKNKETKFNLMMMMMMPLIAIQLMVWCISNKVTSTSCSTEEQMAV